ncbi:MAG: hypothetical protein LHV69_06960 [Elusimicrobia bacterium]|nr:hypothetical protein [Candidatus Obscuribacterium magneticum]
MSMFDFDNDSSSKEKAQEYLKKGHELKSNGAMDAALTEYRRAVLADPSLFAAHLEIGLLCKVKANNDRRFLRYAFEAFRNASRLDLNHEQAHIQYITAGQQLGLLDELHHEYRELCKKYPENELLKRCCKNIVTLCLALIPDKVNLDSGGGEAGMRRFILILSIGLFLLGAAMIFGPPLVNQIFRKIVIAKEQLSTFVTVGLLCLGVSMIGVFIRSRIK